MLTEAAVVKEPRAQDQTIAIAATFTAEPLEDSLSFWLQTLNLSAGVEFAPYNQIFQELLNPSSLLAQNRQGVNIILVRWEDWQRELAEHDDSIAQVERNLDDLIVALRAATGRSSTPYIVGLCPSSPAVQADPSRAAFFQRITEQFIAETSSIPGLYLVQTADFALYPVANYYDPSRDKLGHIPFTPLFFATLGTILARKIYALKHPPYKVIVLDCDNTLWKGVVGEDGVMGIEIPPPWQELQAFMVKQQQAGMVICLCSKNIEADVMEVFDQRQDMILKREHLVAWRVNWMPKSENLKSLAQELNLGLDSFIFIDDNPVECAEVRSACPEVLTLQLPIAGDIPQFLNHIWAFDHLKVTEEDKQRTALYKQNIERSRFQKEAPTISDFLAGLNLTITIDVPTEEQIPRVSQLTQRTNQFNITTIRRSETEIQQLAQAGLECRMVQVSDRFGDYGLVGVMIFGTADNALQVDSFLLSCRVLGRGVEHAMLNHLGTVAQSKGLNYVLIPYRPTKKNLPVLNFLDSVGAAYKQPDGDGACYRFPADYAATVTHTPNAEVLALADEKPKAKSSSVNGSQATAIDKSAQQTRIALELYQPEQILAQLERRAKSARSLKQAFVPPQTATEHLLAAQWCKLLRLDAVGIEDNYFDLGGTSLLAVELFVWIEQEFGKKLPLTTILAAPTIAQLADLINKTDQQTVKGSVVLLKPGDANYALFLIHDGDGETLLYRNLAKRMDPSLPVYGVQPLGNDQFPMLHTRITDMASYYADQIRGVQPVGPYFLGGMCAGGVLAYEVARQLRAQGQQIGLVALMDSADVAAPKRVGHIAGQRMSRFSEALSQGSKLPHWQRWLFILTKVWQKVTNLVQYEVTSRFKRLQQNLKMRLFRYCLDRNRPIPAWLAPISVRTAYNYAELDYRPLEPFDGELVLLRATEGTGTDEPFSHIYSDPLLGWERRTIKGVKVYDVPGGHASMLQEPNVAVMAEILRNYITTQMPASSASNHLSAIL
ncbi:MAG: HAD-IIIC family phosphatase [Cyanobacteria bacterium]|nr:HAD-IIIC family phosphatase [Cyanobacteriota bacterium]MDW8199587.1 HAD-IIIC family phosphatase [Cyanobacteriota bacterium SKYGB_h_bin112]